MENLVGDNIGLTHLIAGMFSVIFGGLILALKKGTKQHRQIG